jgi:hypothetical protein
MKKAHLLALLIASGNVVSVRVPDQTLSITQYLPEISPIPATCWKITQGDNRDFSNPKFDDSGWTTVALPHKNGAFTFSGNADDIYWYRMKFTLPDDMPEHTLGIKLGKLCDIDETFLNGVKIGGTGSFDGGRHGPRLQPGPLL